MSTTDEQKVAAEHRKNAQRRLAERGRNNSVDAFDGQTGWTAQSGGLGAWNETSGDPSLLDPNQSAPGQVYHPSQLPVPEVARRAGFPPVTMPDEFIVTDGKEAVAHPQGPGLGELHRAVEREAILDGLAAKRDEAENAAKAHAKSIGLTPAQRASVYADQGAAVKYEDSQTTAAALDVPDPDDVADAADAEGEDEDGDLEDMTKEQLHEKYGVSTSQSKDDMIAEIRAQQE